MRYIGNKTRLLGFIRRAADAAGLAGGSMHDAFSGTASVGRAFKEDGWRVASSDIMTYSYVFQRAYVVAQRSPGFSSLLDGEPELRSTIRSVRFRAALPVAGARERGHSGSSPVAGATLLSVAEYLSRWIEPERGFITRNYSPAGGRMYFTEENAGRIDAIRRRLHEWRASELIGEDEYYILLAALIEAADRVANTAGVYAAYIKSWQPNARRPLALLPVAPVRGPRGSCAFQGDAAAIAEGLGRVDLLYVDPPYNSRQYAGYYHIPEIIARGWFDGKPSIGGKTGLPARREQRSDWCSARKVEGALEALLEATGARHVLVSYNSEGHLSESSLRSILSRFAADGEVRRYTRDYRRYRADSDSTRRRFRDGALREILFHARLGNDERAGSRRRIKGNRKQETGNRRQKSAHLSPPSPRERE